MAGSLGTISGQVRLDISQAIAAFAAIRAGAASSSGAMASAGTRLSNFGKASMVAGVGMVAAFGMAVNAAADFEKKLDYFGAVNNATAADMEKVRQKALELGRTTAFSAGEVADAFVEMGKAGISAQDITNGMADAIINMASAADIKLTEATNIVTSQIQAYSMSAQDAAHVTDVMAGAANASIIDVSDLGVSLKYVGGVAHGLGITFDSTVDAISLLGKAGIKGSTAGTSLRQIMVSLAGGTKKAQTELKELGIITEDGSNKFFTAEGKAKSLAEIFQILQDHTAGLSDKERLMAFRTIFNNRALAAASILTKEGAKGFAEMNSEISKTTAADVASKRLDNLSGDIQRLKGTFQTLMIEAGTPFQDFMRNIVQGITRILQAFMNLPRGVQTAIMWFLLVGGVLLTLMGSFIVVGGTILKFASVARQLWGAFRILVVGIKAVTLAMRALALTALTNPYVWIAIAVIALVAGLVLLYKRSEKFREIMDAIGRGIKTGFLATVEWFKGLPKWFSDLWKKISDAFKTGVDWVKKNWDILLALVTGPLGLIILVWRRFGDDIVNFFKAIPGAVVGFVQSALNAALNFVKKLPYYIGFAFGFVIGLIVRFTVQAALLLWNWGVTAYNAVVNWFQQLPGRLATFFTNIYNNLVNFSVNFVVTVTNWAVSTYNAVVNWFQKLPGRIYNFFVNAWHWAQGAWNSFKNGAIKFAVDSYNGIVNWFRQLPGRIYNFAIDMKNRAVNAFQSLKTNASNFAHGVYTSFTDWIGKLPGAVWGAVNNAISAFKSMVSSAFSAAKDFAKGLWDGFKSGLGINSPSLIEKQMWQITAVTETETKRLGTHVRLMQNMYGQISRANPAKAAVSLNTTTMTGLTRSMAKQAAVLRSTSAALFPTSASPAAIARTGTMIGGASSTSATAQGSPLVERNINVQVFNPVAERASDSTARKLRQLSDMGAL